MVFDPFWPVVDRLWATLLDRISGRFSVEQAGPIRFLKPWSQLIDLWQSWICSRSGCGFRWSGGFIVGFLDLILLKDLGFIVVDLAEFYGQWWFSVVVMGSDMGRFVVGVVMG